MTPIYLDYHATTPVLPEVLRVMTPYFSENFGNPSSQHSWGWKANLAVNKARTQVARLFGGSPENFLFTSGATESIHLALVGWLMAQPDPKNCHIITTRVEHKATLGAAKIAGKMGAQVTVLEVNRYGQLELDTLRPHLGAGKSCLISVIHGHNEIGTLNNIEALGALVATDSKAVLHVDAAQSAGKLNIDLQKLPVHLLSFSGHKMYGPKGVGGLFVREPRLIHSLFSGGGQEFNLRAGTLNVPGIVGLGEACHWSLNNSAQETPRLMKLRDLFFELVAAKGFIVNGHPTERLPHNINITVPGLNTDRLQEELEGVAFSSGSACSATANEPNHVHAALGMSEESSQCTVRFGLGVHTTEDHVRFLAHKINSLVTKGSS